MVASFPSRLPFGSHNQQKDAITVNLQKLSITNKETTTKSSIYRKDDHTQWNDLWTLQRANPITEDDEDDELENRQFENTQAIYPSQKYNLEHPIFIQFQSAI